MHKNIDAFLKYLEFQKKYSKHTLNSYACDLGQYKSYCEAEDFLESKASLFANHKTIRRWIATLSENKISARTINRKISTLKSFYNFLIRKDLLSENPVKKIIRPKSGKNIPEFVNKDALNLLLNDSIFNSDFSGIRDRLLLELLYGTGMRRDELINLKIRNADIYKGTVKVLGKRNKERIIPIVDYLKKLISEYIELKQECGFNSEFLLLTDKGNKMYPKFVYRTVVKYLQVVTLQDKKSPHVLRHSYATHMLNSGADINAIKELLGHANLSATQIYTHNTFEKLNKIYKQAHPGAQK